MASLTCIASTCMSYLTVSNVVLFVVFLYLLHVLNELYEFKNMPPGPRFTSLPIVGNFFSFDEKSDDVKEATRSLEKKYGPVFSLRLGSYKVVFASSPDAIFDVLVKRSSDFAGRPPFNSFLMETMEGKDIAFGNYGPAWRLHRKIFTTILRRYFTDVPLIEERVSEQVKRSLKFFEEQNGEAFDPADTVTRAIANVICTIAFGGHFDHTHPDFERFFEVNEDLFKNPQRNKDVFALDLFKFTRYLPFKSYKEITDYVNELFAIIRKQLEDRKKHFDPEKDEVRDLISALLKARSESEEEGNEGKAAILTDDYIINTVETMFSAGYDPTSITLRWALAYLVSYPKYQTALQKEIDDVVGRDRLPTLDDRPNLPFVHATIMETLRLANVLQHALPHYTTTDTTLCGYQVPKGTVVLPHIASVHLDPKCWDNPKEFNPYRHIGPDGNWITNQGNFYPFSAGRRTCAGEPMGKLELFLFISNIFHQFTLKPETDSTILDLRGIKALATTPKDYKVRAIKRQ